MSKRTKEKLLKKLEKNYNNSNYAKSVKIANELIKSYPEEKDSYIFKIYSLFYLGKEEDALKLSKKSINLFPDNYVFTEIAPVLIDMGAYALSDEICNLFFQKFEGEKIGDLNYAFLEAQLDNVIEILDKYPKDHPNWKDFYFMKAERYSRLKDYEKTVEVCDEILKEDPYYLNANAKKTYCLINLGRDEEMEELLDFRIKNNIGKYWASVDKAQLKIKNNDIEKGMNDLDEILEIKPYMPYALMVKGLHMYKQYGNFEEAIKYLDKSLEAEDERCYEQTLMIKREIELKFLESKLKKSEGYLDEFFKEK